MLNISFSVSFGRIFSKDKFCISKFQPLLKGRGRRFIGIISKVILSMRFKDLSKKHFTLTKDLAQR